LIVPLRLLNTCRNELSNCGQPYIPEVSVKFLKIPMQSIEKCTECGVCIERCSFELPIPELLKKNYDLFEAHRVQIGLK